MSKKQRKMLTRIIIAAIMLIALRFIPVTGLLRLALYLVVYIIIGYDILRKAGKGILNRRVFDENFLMALATLGAFFLAICGPILLLVFSMRLTPATLAGFYFIFGFGYSLGFSNIMTNALRNIAPQFMPDGNAVFNTCLQFGGAAGTALFSTVLSVAQAGAGKEGTEAFSHATAVGGSWTFTVMIVIVAVAICCLITAFRIGAKRK